MFEQSFIEVCATCLLGVCIGGAVVSWMHRDPTVAFHRKYYDERIYEDSNGTRWFGTSIQKLPFDLMSLQEVLHETRPDVVIESGTHFGGSALFVAHMMDLLGNGRVYTIDIAVPGPGRSTRASNTCSEARLRTR